MSHPRDKRKITGSLNRIQDLMPALSEQLNLDAKVQEMAFLKLWPQVIDPAYAAHTRAVSVKQRGTERVLWVKVGNAALASDLSFQLPVILAALNRYEPQTGLRIDRIQLQVGSIG